MHGRTECGRCQKGVNSILHWSTAGKTALANGFCCNMGDTKYPYKAYVCRRTKLPRRGVHSEKVRETGL